MSTVNERIARLEQQNLSNRDERDGQFKRLLALIEGPPWLESLEGRVAELEKASRTLEVVAATLAEVKTERRKARFERDEESRWHFSNVWKALAALTALLAIVLPYAVRWFG